MLTSIAPEDLNELGLQGGPGENAIRLAALARDAGCAGVVCSAHEVADLKRFFGDDFLTLTPGIRPIGSAHGDQKRVTTPAAAVAAGSDYIVVGRPDRRSRGSGRGDARDPRRDAGARMSDAALALRGALASRGALLEGHFRLSSGRHSDRFVQKFRLLEDPRLLEPVAKEIAARFRDAAPTVVVERAVGGILLAYEVARQLGTKSIFVEKEHGVADAAPRLYDFTRRPRAHRRRRRHDRSLRQETIAVVRAAGAAIVGLGVIVARGALPEGVPSFALLDLPLESYDESECPQCRTGVPIADPGSRRA